MTCELQDIDSYQSIHREPSCTQRADKKLVFTKRNSTASAIHCARQQFKGKTFLLALHRNSILDQMVVVQFSFSLKCQFGRMPQPLLGRQTEETSPSSLLINKNVLSCITLTKYNPIFPPYSQIVTPDTSYFLYYTELYT